MKKILTSFLLLCIAGEFHLAAASLSVDNVALVTIKIENEDKLLPVIIELYDGDAPQTLDIGAKFIGRFWQR